MKLPSHLRRFVFVAIGVIPLVACGASTEEVDSSGGAVSDIPRTRVRDQGAIGNCWMHATAAWIESQEYQAILRTDPGAKQPGSLSVSYMAFFEAFERITGGEVDDATNADEYMALLDDGRWWGKAAESMKRWGTMRAKDFVHRGSTRDSSVILRAYETLARELVSGSLRGAQARRDRAGVRRALTQAFELEEPIAKAIVDTFGEDLSRDFTKESVSPAGGIISPRDLRVLFPRPEGPPQIISASESIGERGPTPKDDFPGDFRVGPHAWSTFFYPAKESPAKGRAFLRRIQAVINAGGTVPIDWFVGNAKSVATTEKAVRLSSPAVAEQSNQHLSLIVDYEVENVPGFGRLKAGEATTPEQKAAALSPQARVVFFRIRNSWGTRYADRTNDLPDGYNDLYVDYLTNDLTSCPGADPRAEDCETLVPLTAVVLPPGF